MKDYIFDLDNLFVEDKVKSAKNLKKFQEEEMSQNENNEQKNLENCLYDKTMHCPVCDYDFKARAIRKGKTRFVKSELDLRCIYDPVSPDYYDVIVCEQCGYAAISSKFNRITDRQAKQIINNISINYAHKTYPKVYDVDVAIERYKLALLNATVKGAKAGEKAYICLKLGWLYREKKDAQNEISYLKSAIEGFNLAFTNENFPICGLEEGTLLYIMSALNYRLGNTDESKKILGRLLVKTNVPEMIKKNAEDLRELLRATHK